MLEWPKWLDTTLASDATGGQYILPHTISSLQTGVGIIGPAAVVLMSENDNRSVQAVLGALPAPGTVLVVAGGSTSQTAMMGSLMAREMQIGKIAGLVTDGLVRDSREIRALKFAVWCRGVSPAASAKNGLPLVGGVVTIGGTVIRDGDLVIADDDGVVIWPQERINELLAKAEAKRQQDEARLALLLKQEGA